MPLESTTVSLAAKHATENHFAEMDPSLTRSGASLPDVSLLNEMNLAFHQQIAIASGNSVLQQVLGVLTSLFTREQRLILDIQNARQEDHEEHLGIVAALKQRQSELAVSRMLAHLRNAQEVLQRWDPSTTPGI